MLGTIAALAAATPILGGLAYRKHRQRRVAKTLAITAPNGIVEERFERIGGIEQWLGIRGENRDNPVLLVLHGGPGSPYSIFTPLLRSWEKHFTIVHWDRRGAGKTLGRHGKHGGGELTFARMVDDAIEVTERVRAHLRKDKVVLLAGSMGTLVGIPLVQARPDLFHAYVGTDQYAGMIENEALTYRLTLERALAAGNARAAAALVTIGADPTAWKLRDWGVKQQWTFETDPVAPNILTGLLLPLALTSPTHTLRDVWDLGVGFELSKAKLFEQWMSYDPRRYGTRFEVPFFVFQGEHDVFTSRTLAEAYVAEVDAPIKGFASIPGATHFAAFTQPKAFLEELLARVRPLAVEPAVAARG